ncbi:hypothetical protein BU26DRAFT_42896 [Trematosphaeria pertusa]|uniref:Uncharacterized protein n=1 Tax=Trematosphaeria pertusa TaxID=390896 RepID=A0A6A6J3J1_9PLEO|nr:uncharacterized protein BU26DRAFT_42896 [Trematosphaeria pertusa]KAF2257395.1 hypothetical protein BU26DRAFT_42896 [Trematosphaeria pertusa]
MHRTGEMAPEIKGAGSGPWGAYVVISLAITYSSCRQDCSDSPDASIHGCEGTTGGALGKEPGYGAAEDEQRAWRVQYLGLMMGSPRGLQASQSRLAEHPGSWELEAQNVAAAARHGTGGRGSLSRVRSSFWPCLQRSPNITGRAWSARGSGVPIRGERHGRMGNGLVAVQNTQCDPCQN